jgi:hypothetical protein
MTDKENNSSSKLENLLNNINNLKEAYNIQTDRSVKVEVEVEVDKTQFKKDGA